MCLLCKRWSIYAWIKYDVGPNPSWAKFWRAPSICVPNVECMGSGGPICGPPSMWLPPMEQPCHMATHTSSVGLPPCGCPTKNAPSNLINPCKWFYMLNHPHQCSFAFNYLRNNISKVGDDLIWSFFSQKMNFSNLSQIIKCQFPRQNWPCRSKTAIKR